MIAGNIRLTRNEVLLNNILGKEFQLMILPLEVMQWLVFQNKHIIIDNFITPKGIYSNLATISFGVTVWAFVIYRSITNIFFYKFSAYPEFFKMCKGGLLLYHTLFITIILYTNITFTDKSVELVLKMQEICKLNKVLPDKKEVLSNWAWLVIPLLDVLITSIFSYILDNDYSFEDIFFYYFKVNFIISVRILNFLRIRLVTWKSRLGDPHQDIRQSERCFVVLLEAYNLFKSHFEILISLQTVHVLLRALNALRRFLLTRRIFDDIGETTMWISLSLLAIWILKNMYLQTIFGYECEQFYFEMEDSMAVCIRLENMNRTSKKHQRILRNIRRLQKASFSKVSACGTFDFDARLPLKMAGALATFALFFLQFFFMK